MIKKIIIIVGFVLIGVILFNKQTNVSKNRNTIHKKIAIDSSDQKRKIENENSKILLNKKNDSSNQTNQFETIKIDTIIKISEKMKLLLEKTDSTKIDEYFINNDILDSINNLYNNSHRVAIAIENYKFQKYKNLIKRDSNDLYVKLKNGKWKKLILRDDYDEAGHTFEHFFEKYNFYSIRVQWGEGNGYKLINYDNGEVTDIIGRPYFSPNGKYMIAINADIEAGYSANGFQLFENNNGKLKKLITFEPEWGPFSAKWIDNNTVIMKNEGYKFKDDDIMEYYQFYTKLKIINGS